MEILTPDFSGKPELLGQVFDAAPEVFAHNLETVPRIFRRIRPAFTYEKSLDVIAQGRAAGMVTKSNLILGMGETRAEISQALVDMHSAGCDLVTITQYLRPTPRHHPVERWVKPQEFVELSEEAEADRLRRRHVRPAGPVLLPGRHAVSAGRGGSRRPRWDADQQCGTVGHRVAPQPDPCGPRHPTGMTRPAVLFTGSRPATATRPPQTAVGTILDSMAKNAASAGASSKTAEKEAKKAAKAAKRVAARNAAARSGRRSRCSASRTRSCCR